MNGEVVELARSGDKDAWYTLVTRHMGLVHAICKGYGLRGEASASVNEVVWLRLVEHLPRIRTPDAVSGWIAATTRAECLSPRRAAGRISWAVTQPTCDRSGLVAAFLRIGVRCQRLLRLVATDPRPSDEEISAALDVAADQVDSTCSRCLDRLGRLLEADGTEVLTNLQRIVAGDNSVPDRWAEAPAAAFGWLTIDAPLAERVYDSVASPDLGANLTLGNGTEVRRMRFAAGSDGVELSLDAKDGEVMLSGQLVPRREVPVTARWPRGTDVMKSDGEGRFRFDGLPLAPLSVSVDGENPLKTGWVVPHITL